MIDDLRAILATELLHLATRIAPRPYRQDIAEALIPALEAEIARAKRRPRRRGGSIE